MFAFGYRSRETFVLSLSLLDRGDKPAVIPKQIWVLKPQYGHSVEIVSDSLKAKEKKKFPSVIKSFKN